MKVVAGMSTQANPSRSVKIVPGLAGFGWIRYKSACVISVGGPKQGVIRDKCTEICQNILDLMRTIAGLRIYYNSMFRSLKWPIHLSPGAVKPPNTAP